MNKKSRVTSYDNDLHLRISQNVIEYRESSIENRESSIEYRKSSIENQAELATKPPLTRNPQPATRNANPANLDITPPNITFMMKALNLIDLSHVLRGKFKFSEKMKSL
jgi:hypothetical protein